MKLKVLIFCLLLPVILFCYNWETFGPADVSINSVNFYNATVCTENGIYVINDFFSYNGLPCVEAIHSAELDEEIIIIMGDGTDSDGIYGLDLDSGEFTLFHWLLNPHFILWSPADSCYYAGGEDGLFESSDGENWEAIDCFNMINCLSMCIYEEHYVVGTAPYYWTSHDAGESWAQSEMGLPLCDIKADMDGIFYGVFPGESYSSGLWKSEDYGENWEVSFWSINMTSVFPFGSEIFVGWKSEDNVHYGIACWNTEDESLSFYNVGLGNYMINSITTNPLINTPNIVCCTENGMWMLINFSSGNAQWEIPIPEQNAYNYPNPFNPETVICWDGFSTEYVRLIIFNLRGEVVKQLNLNNTIEAVNFYTWQALDDNNGHLPSGLYLYSLQSGSDKITGRMLLLK